MVDRDPDENDIEKGPTRYNCRWVEKVLLLES